MNLFAEQQWRCRHKEQICGHREGKGGTNWESNMETYTLPYVKRIASGNLLCDTGSSTHALRQPKRVGWGGRWQRGSRGRGTYVYLWLIHVDVWQKPAQYCKAIILQYKTYKKVTSISFKKKIKSQTFQKYEATLELCIQKFVLIYT